MPNRLLFLLLLCFSGSLFADSPKPLEPEFTKDILERLDQGEAVFFERKKARGHAGVAILIDGEKADVWRVLSDPESAPSYVPSLKSARILLATGNTRLIAHEVKMPLMPKVNYQFEATELPMRTIQFKQTTGDLSNFEGEWELYEGETYGRPDSVIVFYQVYLNPGKLIPAPLVQRSLRKDLPPMLECVRTRVYEMKN
tara:strand:+ start:9071 stop:9667 length:597 start_codon:yes stop_codon:yes gene_type:complete